MHRLPPQYCAQEWFSNNAGRTCRVVSSSWLPSLTQMGPCVLSTSATCSGVVCVPPKMPRPATEQHTWLMLAHFPTRLAVGTATMEKQSPLAQLKDGVWHMLPANIGARSNRGTTPQQASGDENYIQLFQTVAIYIHHMYTFPQPRRASCRRRCCK